MYNAKWCCAAEADDKGGEGGRNQITLSILLNLSIVRLCDVNLDSQMCVCVFVPVHSHNK